jgi:CelD/BcsL family acetyltransferase involved in cellulose biosynthesis
MHWIDPIADLRWAEFLFRHPDSSVFHTPAWLTALQVTYGYKPLVLTTSPPGAALENGIPFCRVNSVLTGKRLVSLPFSDHCQPLSPPQSLLEELQEIHSQQKLKYIELRPLESTLAVSEGYWLHILDLRPPLEDIQRKFHPDCVRRKIRRAERENLATEEGRSEKLLDEFYSLQVRTRRRHRLPPQPRQWFRNVLDALGEKAEIRVARYRGRPVASILTLRHKTTAVYKYGCSAVEDNSRGGMQLLFWQHIQDAKARGMEWMDLGRCDIGDEGLAEFKERWGAVRREIGYYRFPAHAPQRASKPAFVSKLPAPILIAAGRLLYRHMG